jgi:hypothetical protein
MNKRHFSSALIVIALIAAVVFVYSARDELIETIRSASILFLGLLYAATLTQNIILWLVFHASAGAGRAYLQTSRMHFGGQVAKYLPGKVWALIYQATLKSDSMPVGHIVQGNIVIYALGVLSVVFASLALISYPLSMPLAVVVLATGGALSAYFMSSDHLYRIIQRFSRLSARFELTESVPATDFSIVTRVGVYLALLLAYVLSNVFLLYAFFDFDLHQALRLSAYLGIAWLAGIIVAISPSGIGVREAVFIGIGYAGDASSLELYASIAIMARAIQILQDLVSAFLVPTIVGLASKKHEAGA